MQPKGQISLGYLAHKASAPGAQQLSLTSSTTPPRPRIIGVSLAQASSPQQYEEINCPTQTLNLGHAAKKLIQIIKNNAECTIKDESDEIKNEYSLRKRLQVSICRRLYIRRRAEGEEGEWASAGVSGSPE